MANYSQLSQGLSVVVLDGNDTVMRFASVYAALQYVYDTQQPPQVGFPDQLAYMVHYFACMGFSTRLDYN